jgi:hypothetical protein
MKPLQFIAFGSNSLIQLSSEVRLYLSFESALPHHRVIRIHETFFFFFDGFVRFDIPSLVSSGRLITQVRSSLSKRMGETNEKTSKLVALLGNSQQYLAIHDHGSFHFAVVAVWHMRRQKLFELFEFREFVRWREIFHSLSDKAKESVEY